MFRKKAALSLLSLLISLFSAELFLRLTGWSAPLFRKPHSTVGWKLREGLQGYHRKENVNFISINENGFHDVRSSPLRPRERPFVAFFGDSFTQAAEVPRLKNFVSKTEELLHDYGFSALSTFNFGVVGYSTSQSLLLYREMKADVKPDVVVYTMYIGNDISDNHPALAESIPELRPFFAIKEGELRQRPNYPRPNALKSDEWTARMVNSLRLIQLAKEAALGMRAAAFPQQHTSAPLHQRPLYKPPKSDSPWEKAWIITERLLATFAAEVRERGGVFLLTIAPEAEGLTCSEDGYAPCYPTRRLLSFARERGIWVVDLGKALFQSQSTFGAPVYGFPGPNLGLGHWNEKGHAAVASALVVELERALRVNPTQRLVLSKYRGEY